MGVKGAIAPSTEGSGYNSTYSAFVKAFETLQLVIPPRGPRGNLWPAWELFNNVAAESNKAIDDWVAPLVRQAIDAKAFVREAKKSGVAEGSLLDHIAESSDDVKLIRDEVMPYFREDGIFFAHCWISPLSLSTSSLLDVTQ